MVGIWSAIFVFFPVFSRFFTKTPSKYRLLDRTCGLIHSKTQRYVAVAGKQRIFMNKPYFMTNKSWYVTIPPKKRIPDYPNIDMALTNKAEDDEKAVISYQKYYNLGTGIAFYMDKGEVVEEDLDAFDQEEDARLQLIYDTIDE